MKATRTLLPLWLFLALASCRNNKSADYNEYPITIKLDLSDIADEMQLSEIAGLIEYIPLQTTGESLLKDISYFKVTEESYFIQNSSVVKKFDANGVFQGNLFTRGNGPGEASGRSFTLDESNRIVYVLINPNKVKKYSFDAQYIEDLNYSFPYLFSIGYFNNNLLIPTPQYVGVDNLYSCLDLASDSLTVLYENYRTYAEAQRNLYGLVTDDQHFQINESGILYKETFCDTIYHVDEDLKQVARYIIDLGNRKLTWETWRDQGMFSLMEGGQPPYGYYVKSFVESKSFLFMVLKSYNVKEPALFVAYNKDSKSSIITSSENYEFAATPVSIKNDLDNFMDFTPMNNYGIIYDLHDNCLYGLVPAFQFIDEDSKLPQSVKETPAYIEDIAPIANSIDENSNPIIMKVHLK